MQSAHVDGLGLQTERPMPKIVQKAKEADARLVALVKDKPLVALGAAVAIGYLIGRAFSRLG
jgi:ElaB/YqjD/DUF883 family membrane-anchored ribosome-binding protein